MTACVLLPAETTPFLSGFHAHEQQYSFHGQTPSLFLLNHHVCENFLVVILSAHLSLLLYDSDAIAFLRVS